jgi:sigma-B regulation protein RsbU (phosphoserine phosphatase)
LIKLHSSASEIFLSLQRKDGTDIPVLVNAKRRVEGKNVFNDCICIEVNQRKKYEEEILNAKREAEQALLENKQLQALATQLEEHSLELDSHLTRQKTQNENLVALNKVISHDLQEPIRKIQLFTNMLVSDASSSFSLKSQSLISKIETCIRRIDTLTSGLHQYVAVDTDKRIADVSLQDVFDTALEKAKEHEKFYQLELKTQGLQYQVEGYRTQLELLFFHLIDNSIKYRQPEAPLAINISCMELDENVYKATRDKYKFSKHIRINFSDNGIGFSKQYHDYVFQMLNKLDPTLPGLGLGLSLVKRIVDNHFGIIKVKSEQQKGTSFVIDLPVSLQGTVNHTLKT